jgi:hypothetical protein
MREKKCKIIMSKTQSISREAYQEQKGRGAERDGKGGGAYKSGGEHRNRKPAGD